MPPIYISVSKFKANMIPPDGQYLLDFLRLADLTGGLLIKNDRRPDVFRRFIDTACIS